MIWYAKNIIFILWDPPYYIRGAFILRIPHHRTFMAQDSDPGNRSLKFPGRPCQEKIADHGAIV